MNGKKTSWEKKLLRGDVTRGAKQIARAVEGQKAKGGELLALAARGGGGWKGNKF